MSTPQDPPPGRLATLHPAYFALVMATGIVSIASKLTGVPWVPEALFWANFIFYPTLWALTLARLALYRSRFLSDLSSHPRAVGFFTIVAATSVVGSQLVVVGEAPGPALAFWVAGIALYVLLIYAIFGLLMVKEQKPALAEGLNGGWLVAIVAAQSIAVLGAQLAPSFGSPEPALFFCLAMWLGGGMLYFWIISLVFYRYAFFTMAPSDLAPPYWINMGAAAISTLAGATLIAAAPKSPLLTSLLPFLKGFTVLWWATATWWIPMLLFLGAWRHLVRRFPLRYDPLYWGAVFPLGMYTAATFRLARALDVPFLQSIPSRFIAVALAAWALAFVGLARDLARAARGEPS